MWPGDCEGHEVTYATVLATAPTCALGAPGQYKPLLFLAMRVGKEKAYFWLPVQQGCQLLGYVGSEGRGGLKLVAILLVLIHLLPTTHAEGPHFPPAQQLAL